STRSPASGGRPWSMFPPDIIRRGTMVRATFRSAERKQGVNRMAQLVVVRFKGTERAAQVLGQLHVMEDRYMVELRDAVAVYRDNNGTLRLDENLQPTEGEGAGMGALWGGLLGMLIAIPLTGGVAAVTAGALAAGMLTGGTVGAAAGAYAV